MLSGVQALRTILSTPAQYVAAAGVTALGWQHGNMPCPWLHHNLSLAVAPCPAGLSVRELTGDTQLSKKELAETQASSGLVGWFKRQFVGLEDALSAPSR